MQTHHAAISPEIGFHLIRASDLIAVPWKNGGGTTRQVAVFPEGATLDTFVWRISAAMVEQAGPFSIFSGVDRFIVVTHGSSMALVDAAQGRRSLQRGQPFAFAGEAALAAELPEGPVQDFNLMVRRGQGLVGELSVRQAPQRLVLCAGSAVLHCVGGSFTVSPAIRPGSAYRLAEGDSLQATLPAGCRACVEIVPEQDGATLIDARINQA